VRPARRWRGWIFFEEVRQRTESGNQAVSLFRTGVVPHGDHSLSIASELIVAVTVGRPEGRLQ